MGDGVLFDFTVFGAPVAKGRPRFNTKTGQAYTDDKTAKYENLVKLSFKEKYPDFEPSEEALSVSIMACFPIPVSWSKKRRTEANDGRIKKTTRPDADNVVKAVFDALNGVAWKDDAQVVTLHVYKLYSTYPRLEVMAWEEVETNE